MTKSARARVMEGSQAEGTEKDTPEAARERWVRQSRFQGASGQVRASAVKTTGIFFGTASRTPGPGARGRGASTAQERSARRAGDNETPLPRSTVKTFCTTVCCDAKGTTRLGKKKPQADATHWKAGETCMGEGWTKGGEEGTVVFN